MQNPKPRYTEWKKNRSHDRFHIKLISKAVSMVDIEEVGGLRTILMEHGPLITSFAYKVHPQYTQEETPEEWSKYLNPGETLLHLSCRKGHSNIAGLLLTFGADINCQSLPPVSSTPLHFAAVTGVASLMDMLLENGAQSKAVNDKNENAFLITCKEGSQDIVFKIMSMGTGTNSIIDDYNARNNLGQSALWLSCYNGLLPVVIELCKIEGVSLMEEADNCRRSLLHAACLRNSVDVATFLMNNGSSPGGRGIYPDKYGKLPFEYLTDAGARRTLTLAAEQFRGGGGDTGLRLRRKKAEEMLLGDAFNWYHELKSLDPRPGIHSGKTEDDEVFVVHASKHQKTTKRIDKLDAMGRKAIDDCDESVPEVHDIYSPHGSTTVASVEHEEGDGAYPGLLPTEESQLSFVTTHTAELTSQLNKAFVGKDMTLGIVRPAAAHHQYDPHIATTSVASSEFCGEEEEEVEEEEDKGKGSMASSSAFSGDTLMRLMKQEERGYEEERERDLTEIAGKDYVPSIYNFLVKFCDFPEGRAMKCAKISKMRNILHLNKLYVILQALESMQQTNFTFKDIGVFHADERKLREALRWYVFYYTIVLPFLFLFVRSPSLSCLSIAACLHSLAPHGTSLTVTLSLPQSIIILPHRYYTSGAMTSLGVIVKGDSGTRNEFAEKHLKQKMSQKHHKVALDGETEEMKQHKSVDAHLQNASEGALLFVYRTRKPKIGLHKLKQKFQPEEKARIAEKEALERLQNLFH
jgi:hypothetical protein